MSLPTGAGALEEARKILLARWREVRTGWDDGVARRFEEEVVEPLAKDLTRGADAMNAAATQASASKRDCG